MQPIDKKTELIIAGYIRNIAKSLSSSVSVPDDVASIILTNIDDYFMLTSGEFEWIINDQQKINEMLTANNGQKFRSPIFEMAKLQWILETYPNGNGTSHVGSFNLFLRLLTMPKRFKTILVCRTLECIQMKAKSFSLTQYTDQKSSGWPSNTLLLSDLLSTNRINELTFSVHIKTIRIESNENEILYQMKSFDDCCSKDVTFQWNINNQLKQSMHNRRKGKGFVSPIFNRMWCMECFPNGKNVNGVSNEYIDLVVSMIEFPRNVNDIKTKISICVNDDIFHSEIATFNINSDPCKTCVFLHQLIKINDFVKYSSVKIDVKIQFLSQTDIHGDVHDISMKDWHTFIKQQNEIVYIEEKSEDDIYISDYDSYSDDTSEATTSNLYSESDYIEENSELKKKINAFEIEKMSDHTVNMAYMIIGIVLGVIIAFKNK